MSDPIQILLADDHIVVLQGLKGLLEDVPGFEVVALAQNGDELLDCLEKYQVDVVVMDLEMPYHGFQALEEIRRRKLPVRVVVLTAFGDGDSIQSALERGAEGFALKTESPVQLIESIKQVAGGRIIFPRAAQRWIVSRKEGAPVKGAPADPFEDLSAREQEVLAHVARGHTNTEIARSLGVSENTVRFHLKNIFSKINVTNRTEAAGWYFERGGERSQGGN